MISSSCILLLLCTPRLIIAEHIISSSSPNPFDNQQRNQSIKKSDDNKRTHKENESNQQKISQIQEKAWLAVSTASILDHSITLDYGSSHPFQNRIPSKTPHRTLYETGITRQNTSPIRIFFDTTLFSQVEQTEENIFKLSTLTDTILPNVAHVWSEALSVVPVRQPIRPEPDTCFNFIDIPDKYVRGDGIPNADLVVFVNAEDCGGIGSLAYAFPCAQDQYDRPIIGLVSICLESLDLDVTFRLEEAFLKSFTEVVIHEIGHVLGMSAPLYPYFRDSKTGEPLTDRPLQPKRVRCVDGKSRMVVEPSERVLKERKSAKSVTYFDVVTPTVAQVVKNQFDCNALEGARLENQPTNVLSCYGSHWDERLFFTEAMGPIYSRATNILSPLTLAIFEDSGWYVANYTSVGISPFGHAAGCDFVEKDCIASGGAVPEYGRGYFCNRVSKLRERNGLKEVEGNLMCDPSHTHKALCDLFDGEFKPAPDKFQYFQNKNLVPAMDQADFCPIPRLAPISCKDTTQRSSFKDEVFGPTSKCFNVRTRKETSICLPSRCNEEEHILEVFVNGEMIKCDSDNQVHVFDDRSIFYCPRFASACPDLICPSNCSGRGICDYTRKNPECICFDFRDTSPGCYGMIPPPPTDAPSSSPSGSPSVAPSLSPSMVPSLLPSSNPSVLPTNNNVPSQNPMNLIEGGPEERPEEGGYSTVSLTSGSAAAAAIVGFRLNLVLSIVCLVVAVAMLT